MVNIVLPTFGVRAKAAAPALAILADGTALLVHGGYADRFDPAATAATFADVVTKSALDEYVANLAARGIIHGYGDGTFGPWDPVLRAQVAAMVARGMAWETESYANPFPDRGPVDDELWRAVATLTHYRVAQGYRDGTYDPTGPVLKIQVVSLVTRAQLARGYWIPIVDERAIYRNVPESSGARADLVQFVAHAGAVPDVSAPSTDWFEWDQPATRAWTAQVLCRPSTPWTGRRVKRGPQARNRGSTNAVRRGTVAARDVARCGSTRQAGTRQHPSPCCLLSGWCRMSRVCGESRGSRHTERHRVRRLPEAQYALIPTARIGTNVLWHASVIDTLSAMRPSVEPTC